MKINFAERKKNCQMRHFCARHTIHFSAKFWVPFRCPNWAQDSSLEILSCLVSKYPLYLKMDLIWPLKKCFSQDFSARHFCARHAISLPNVPSMLQVIFGWVHGVQIELMIDRWNISLLDTQWTYQGLKIINYSPSKINSPKTSQKVQNEGAKMKCALVDNFLRPSSTQNWAHDSALEIYFCLVLIWLIKKVIWTVQLEDKLIFQRSLQKCRNPLVAIVFFHLSKIVTPV